MRGDLVDQGGHAEAESAQARVDRAAFERAAGRFALVFDRDAAGGYTDSRTGCLFTIWNEALAYARPMTVALPRINPVTGMMNGEGAV